MKAATAKRKRKGAKGRMEPSILDYFSKSKRNKPARSQGTPSSTSFGTPMSNARHGHDRADAISESQTPASVVSDDAEDATLSRKSNSLREKQYTPAGDATPDTGELKTPPSQGLGSDVPSERKRGMSEMGGTSVRSETPPSNDTQLTTPRSPPTPETSRDCPTDQKENATNFIVRNHSPQRKGQPKSTDDATPKSLLESSDARYRSNSLLRTQSLLESNDVRYRSNSLLQKQEIHGMGTPSSGCTPSTNAALKMGTPSTACSPSEDKHSHSRRLGQNTTSSGQTTSRTTRRQRHSSQLFLDFGQNSFGKQSICNTCGMLRVLGLEEDDAQHAKVCKAYKEGVTCLGWKNERSVATFGKDDRILEVRPDDAQQHLNKVVEVKKIVDKELGFANRSRENTSVTGTGKTTYMFISKKRVVGLLVVKRIQRAYELLQAGVTDDNNVENSISRSLKPSKALLGVHQIWVHKAHRHRGIASKLVTAARDHLIFGMVVPLELVAFSSPTDAGLRFAKGYTGSERPLIYDIQ